MTHGLPRGWRIAIDWVVTIVGAVAIVLAIKAWVVNPYRIPSSSMEPTLHCARPGSGCEAGTSDRVLANRFIYHFRDPRRDEIVVFHAPKAADAACIGGIFVYSGLGKLTGLECVRVEWAKGADGRMAMQEVAGSAFTLKADLVLLAMGFLGPHRDPLLTDAGVDLDPRGNVKANVVDYASTASGVSAPSSSSP